MKHHSLRHSNFFLRNNIQKSEDKLIRRKIPITNGKIISDQSFGFWVSFFLSHHYALIGGQPIHIFKNKPVNIDRACIYSNLDDIKKFRNRMNHCEPICFIGNKIDCNKVLEIRSKIYELLKWIDPNLIPFFEKIDNILHKVNNLTRI